MVTFTAQGRMGNFLFECATAYAYAKDHGLEFTVPHYCTDEFHNPVYLKHLRNQNYNPHFQNIVIWEKQHQYAQIPFEESWRDKNITLIGYWQTEKYFKHHRESILRDFNFKWTPEIGVVSVHVRRGDYVTFREKHPEIGYDFYLKAFNYFLSRGLNKFKIFSDDIPYCKEYFTSVKFDNCQFSFSEGKSIEEDLVLMSGCQHHVNSSSTYSYWGAWLNRNVNKVVITPRLWFSENWGGLDVSDIVPENWIKI